MSYVRIGADKSGASGGSGGSFLDPLLNMGRSAVDKWGTPKPSTVPVPVQRAGFQVPTWAWIVVGGLMVWKLVKGRTATEAK